MFTQTADTGDQTAEPGTLSDMPGPRKDPDIPDLVSQAEAGRILDVSKQRVSVLVSEGRLMGKQVAGSGAWVFRRALVEELRPKIGKRS